MQGDYLLCCGWDLFSTAGMFIEFDCEKIWNDVGEAHIRARSIVPLQWGVVFDIIFLVIIQEMWEYEGHTFFYRLRACLYIW